MAIKMLQMQLQNGKQLSEVTLQLQVATRLKMLEL